MTKPIRSQEQNKKRTDKQRDAHWLLFQQIADYCVEHGITTEVLVKNFEVYPTKETIADMFRQAGKRKFGKDKTRDFTSRELQLVYEDVVGNQIQPITGEYFPFPSEETRLEALQSYEQFIR